MDSYQSWPQFEDYEGIQNGESVHGAHVKVWVNDLDAANPA
jgi:hypothetical protein